MLLLVGLGNPGPDYAENRHNIGFMALDRIAERHKFEPWKQKFQGEVAEGRIGGFRAIALKPRTYMNESGQSVGAVMQFYKLPQSSVIVLHDELDLPAGRLKVKTGGGHAGHNGLRSIEAHVGAEFHRVRIGIGHPGSKDMVHNWVLGNFAKADADWLNRELDAIARCAVSLAANDFAGFMNDVARIMGHEQDKPERVARTAPSAAIEGTPAAKPAPDASLSGPPPAAKNAMAETLRGLLADKKPPGRRPGG